VPILVNQWRSLTDLTMLDEASDRIPEGASPAENLKIAQTEAEQWKHLFSQLRAEHKQLIEHSQQLQQQSTDMVVQFQEQQQALFNQQDAQHQESLQKQETWHQELLQQQEARHQDMQQHTAQQVFQIQSDTRELAKVLRERNETDALVRRALGEGEHWMQTLMQLQEIALQFVANDQERGAAEIAATQAATESTQRFLERQQRDVQQLTLEVRELVSQMQRFESTASQMSSAVLHNVKTHQSALQDSVAKLRTLIALQADGPGVAAPTP
jgi:hypothetical protein